MNTRDAIKEIYLDTESYEGETDITCHSAMMFSLGAIAMWIGDYGDPLPKEGQKYLLGVVSAASAMLHNQGVHYPLPLYMEEYDRACDKHPGHTFDIESVPMIDKYWALAEEIGEVAAAMTYDNDKDTGHKADLIHEITQVGALALAWLTCYV